MTEPRDDGVPLSASVPRFGAELIIVTHNFCEPTTWYGQSGRAQNEFLTDSGDGLTWTSAHANWIDLTHGKLFDEDAIRQDVPHGYLVAVTVDGAAMIQRAPFADSGGDYTVDYRLGRVTFAVSQAGKTVVASYSYEQGSRFLIQPDPGKRIDIEAAEVQFSRDVQLNDSIEFNVWAYDPTNLPNKVLVEQTTYKRMVNYIDEALGSYPVIPAIGGAKRGVQADIFGFPFRYGTLKALRSSQGVELHIQLAAEQAFSGEHATGTFYCTVRDE